MRFKHIRIKLFKNLSVLLSKPKKYIYLFLKMFFYWKTTHKKVCSKFIFSYFRGCEVVECTEGPSKYKQCSCICNNDVNTWSFGVFLLCLVTDVKVYNEKCIYLYMYDTEKYLYIYLTI